MTAKEFPMTSLLHSLTRIWKRFWGDANGAVLFYITATLPALVGFSLLAIDASRLMSLHTSLQKGVDALAIAAAGELDRAPNSFLRANVAIANLVKNSHNNLIESNLLQVLMNRWMGVIYFFKGVTHS